MTFSGSTPSKPAPTVAERVRSTCARRGGALLAVDQAAPVSTPLHHLLADGFFAVAVPVTATSGCGSASRSTT